METGARACTLGTPYHERMRRFLAHVQAEDLVCQGAMADVKGDRGARPGRQEDPDLYLRVVRRTAGHEALTVFDNVEVPMERVFLLGEVAFSGKLVERFAGFHRQSYGGCKAGVGDVLIGAAALAADCNGVAGASHVRDKLVEMIGRPGNWRGYRLPSRKPSRSLTPAT